jgi:tripartite-type tricarboxylate transporter receptor subunit TctC
MRDIMQMKLLVALAATMLAFNSPANAQKFPDRPMTMIIPFAAGGPTDILGRVMAGRMSELLGQQVVVENVTGAGGMTGSARVAKAAPDGYQLLLGTVGSAAQGQTLYKHPLYNTVTDFTPVILIAEVPLVLITRKDLPVSNFKEFVAYANEHQAEMQFGSAGAGSATHLGCVLMNYLVGVKITHVPYRGTGPAMQDLQGGRIDFLCDVMTTAKHRSIAVRSRVLLSLTASVRRHYRMRPPRRSKACPILSPTHGTPCFCRRVRQSRS